MAYARVDVIGEPTRPVLIELELIEPDLYFTWVPEAAPRWARALARTG